MSELRDSFPVCPLCDAALDATSDGSREYCTACKGQLIGEASLLALVNELLHRPIHKLPLEAPLFDEAARTCPHCLARMTKHALYSIQIDRCEAHGIWFDGAELARVVELLSLIPPPKGSIPENIYVAAFAIVWFGALIAGILIGP